MFVVVEAAEVTDSRHARTADMLRVADDIEFRAGQIVQLLRGLPDYAALPEALALVGAVYAGRNADNARTQLLESLGEALNLAVTHAVEEGATWEQIGCTTGMARGNAFRLHYERGAQIKEKAARKAQL